MAVSRGVGLGVRLELALVALLPGLLNLHLFGLRVWICHRQSLDPTGAVTARLNPIGSRRLGSTEFEPPSLENHLQKRRALLAATSLAIVLAGCGGGSSGPSLSAFKRGFAASKVQFRQLGADLGASLQKATTRSNSQLAAEFDKLSARARADVTGLRKLDPPAKFKPELKQFISGLDAVGRDLARIARAADTSDVKTAKAATTALITNAATVRTADNVLTARLGLPKTG